MEAKARPFSFIEEVEILEIPFFQRSYVWERENWEELLSDLLKVGHNPLVLSQSWGWNPCLKLAA